MEYKWGIIGAGRIADNIFAPAIKQSKNSRLLSIMARDKTKAEAFAKKHEVAKFYDTAEVNNCYIAEIEHFLQCVAEKSIPAVSGQEAKKNVRVVLAAYRSVDEGRSILIDEYRSTSDS